MPSLLSPAEAARFHTDGFVIVRAMFDAAETELLRCAMEQDPEVAGHLLDWLDAHGAATRIALWNRAGDSVYGMAARCARMVDTMEALLGGPVYHFQSKLTAKAPFVGGAWEWHQDYGYWYHNGCVFPHLASCQVAPGFRSRGGAARTAASRWCRVPICLAASTTFRFRARARTSPTPPACGTSSACLPVVPCELEPGDAVFFAPARCIGPTKNRSPHRR